MFTVCPKCTLTLVVTTVDLRAGQGYVRCGRCANVFNALIALREGDPNTAVSDSTRQRMIDPPPSPSVQPALGSGVALEPEPEPQPEPVSEPEPELEPEPLPEQEPEPEAAPEDELTFGLDEPEAPPAEGSLEFDATATDVSDIFVSPSQADHDTGSGSYEAVVLAVEPPPPEPEPGPELEPESEHEGAPEFEDASHTDTIAADDWSLLDDDEPAADAESADAESIIEESPLAEAQDPDAESFAEPMAEAETEATQETSVEDPAWVHDMFAEAEADAIRSRTAEHRALESAGIVDEGEGEESAVVQAARDFRGVSAPSGDTVLEPLLAPAADERRPAWQYITGIVLLAIVLALQVLHHNRRSLVLNSTLGPLVSTVYGWLGATITPRWDLTAYEVRQLGVEAQGSDGSRLRVRLSVQNDSDRVQPLPLVRLTLTDRFDKPVATRDLEPKEYLPPKIADRRLLEPNQRIDGELHVIDPGRAAVGFEIDACLRSESGQIGCANQIRRRPD